MSEWCFTRLDPEEKLGLRGVKYTGVGNVAAMTLGVVLAALFYGVLTLLRQRWHWAGLEMFFHGGAAGRSFIPYLTVLLSMWTAAILIFKRRKLRVQRSVLKLQLTQAAPEAMLRELESRVDAPDDFLATRRLKLELRRRCDGLSRVECAEMRKIAAEMDEKYLESTFTLPRGLIWAIPVTGFIGTVVGLARAVGGFGMVLTGGGEQAAKLRDALGSVTGALAVAFETTLIALAAALILQLLLTMQIKAEEDLLDAVPDFVDRNADGAQG